MSKQPSPLMFTDDADPNGSGALTENCGVSEKGQRFSIATSAHNTTVDNEHVSRTGSPFLIFRDRKSGKAWATGRPAQPGV
jgi:hypothetical protein